MNLSQERKIKFWLTIIVKVLLGVFIAFQLFQLIFDKKTEIPAISEEVSGTKDTPIEQNNGEPEGYRGNTVSEPTTPASSANTASIYIYSGSSLDNQLNNQLGKTFFKNYALKVGGSADKSQLLSGNLNSSANTELVCIGTVDYNYYTNQMDMITCELNLSFETYNKITGDKITELSRSFSESGPGFTEAKALQVALQKIHP